MSPKDSGATAVTSETSASGRTARTEKRAAKQSSVSGPTPTWWAPVSLTFMVIGLIWVVTYYVTSGSYPIPGIDMVNMFIGFAAIMIGFVMLTRWK